MTEFKNTERELHNFRVRLSVAGLFAETILRIYTEESVSSLFIE